MTPAFPEGLRVPIGLRLSQAARAVERAFDEALAGAGGTLPVWLILLNLVSYKPATQKDLAEKVGIKEATLTHHLNGLEERGLITRSRVAANRRVQVVALTDAGEAAFLRLRDAAIAFDARLRAGLSDADVSQLHALLGALAANAARPPREQRPSGLGERSELPGGMGGRPPGRLCAPA